MKKLRYIIEALIVRIFFYISGALPFTTSSNIGGTLARIIGPKLGVNKIAMHNITIAMPELSEQERKKIIYDMWDNLGRVAAEYAHIGSMTEKEFYEIASVSGIENIERAKQKNKSIIFVSAHLSNWEFAPKMVHLEGFGISLVYRMANNPYVNDVICSTRNHYQKEGIPKGKKGAKLLIKAIENGDNIGMLLDQKMNDGIAVPFFGIPAMTAPAIASLALKYECPIVPVKVERFDRTKFKVTALPALKIIKTDNNEQDVLNIMTDINIMIEQWIRQNPQQWFWVHKRWGKF